MNTLQKGKAATGKGAEKKPKEPFVIKGWMMIVGGLVGGLLLVGGVLFAASYFGEDPNLKRIKEIRAQLDDSSLTDDQKRELRRQIDETEDKLTDEQRRQLREERGREFFQRWQQEEDAKIDRYFAMSAEQQVAFLQEEAARDIAREERDAGRRAEWAARAAAGPPRPPSTASGSGSSQGGSRGGSDGFSGSRYSQYLDRSTPQQRAKRDEYRRQKEKAKQQAKAAKSAAKSGT